VANNVSFEAIRGEAIVRSAAAGDDVAFARLVAEHHASLARVAFVICGEPEMTRDAVQSAWGIAWRRIGSLREPSRIRPWLVAIAANEARKLVSRRRSRPILDISATLVPATRTDLDGVLDTIDLELVLRALRPEDRTLLAMRYAAGLDSSEIARQLGLSASGVRSRLARLLERLRIELALEPETEA
jgi:RNA polymerase sigma-70 factor (ECF subfamily)